MLGWPDREPDFIERSITLMESNDQLFVVSRRTCSVTTFDLVLLLIFMVIVMASVAVTVPEGGRDGGRDGDGRCICYAIHDRVVGVAISAMHTC